MNSYTEEIIRRMAENTGLRPGSTAFDSFLDRYRPLSDVKDLGRAFRRTNPQVHRVFITRVGHEDQQDEWYIDDAFADCYEEVRTPGSGIAVSIHIDTGFYEDGVWLDQGVFGASDQNATLYGVEATEHSHHVMCYNHLDVSSMRDPFEIFEEEDVGISHASPFVGSDEASWFAASVVETEIVAKISHLHDETGDVSLMQLNLIADKIKQFRDAVSEAKRLGEERVRSRIETNERKHNFGYAMPHASQAELDRWQRLLGVLPGGKLRPAFHMSKGGFVSQATYGAVNPTIEMSNITIVPCAAGYNRKKRRFNWFGRFCKLVGGDRPCKESFHMPLSMLMDELIGDVTDLIGETRFSNVSVRPLGEAQVRFPGHEGMVMKKVSVHPVSDHVGIAVAIPSSGNDFVKSFYRWNKGGRQTGAVNTVDRIPVPRDYLESVLKLNPAMWFAAKGAPDPVLNLSNYRLGRLKEKLLTHVLEEKTSLFILEGIEA